MAESPTTKPHVEKEDSYRAFVTDLARKVPRFAPLNAFFQQTTTAAAVSTLITFSDQTAPSTPRQLTFDDLKHELESGSEEAKLFIVENLCPDAAALLGGHCNVDPQCFLDYLDKYQLETPDENWKRKAGQFSPINWYRIDGVDEHLPILHSEKSELDHVHFRYIEAEEF